MAGAAAPDPISLTVPARPRPATRMPLRVDASGRRGFDPIARCRRRRARDGAGRTHRSRSGGSPRRRRGRAFRGDVPPDQPGVYRVGAEARRARPSLGTRRRRCWSAAPIVEMTDPRLERQRPAAHRRGVRRAGRAAERRSVALADSLRAGRRPPPWPPTPRPLAQRLVVRVRSIVPALRRVGAAPAVGAAMSGRRAGRCDRTASLCARLAQPASAAERYALIVSGASGRSDLRRAVRGWPAGLSRLLRRPR